MSAHASKKVIVLALGANAGIAAAKFVAYFFTRSSSMLAEAAHSIADTGNQLLLLLGLSRAARPPDDRHPFGYKMESYFWSFVVAIMLFSVGGLFAIYEGAHKLSSVRAAMAAGEMPTMENAAVAIGVLIVSIGLEGYSWLAATREINRQRGDLSLFEFIGESKSTEIVVIWLEDTGALAGLLLALLGIALALLTGNMAWDAYATFAVGVLLVVIAFVVARETKSLLIGESATQKSQDAIRKIATEHAGVTRLLSLRTMQLGEDEFLAALKVEWQRGLSAERIAMETNALEQRIRAAIPRARYLFIETDVYDAERTN